METRKLGSSNLSFSVVTMGCWQAGGTSWNDTSDESSIAAIRAALEAGITSFDTAEGYGDGHSEEIVAKALDDKRDEVLIATKFGPDKLAADKVAEACEKSLRCLNTDRIDLYQIHWPSGSWGTPPVPIEETMTALNKLKAAGKIRAIGVSNFSGAQIEALQFGQIDSLQPPYSLLWRTYETNGTFQTCVENNVGIIAYSPLAQGLLTGKFNLDNKPEGDNRSGDALFSEPHYANAVEAVAQLKTIANKYDVSTGNLALQWLLGQPGVTSVIVGARTAEQARDNVRAAAFQISDEDRAAIDRIGRSVTDNLPQDQTNMWA